jgi:hypothetical protein
MKVNPFTKAQQTQDWGVNWEELSVSWPPMNQAEFATWQTFLAALDGVVNYFTFSAAACAQYPVELTNGATPTGPLNFRLKQDPHYTIEKDRYYRLTFEVIQAL